MALIKFSTLTNAPDISTMDYLVGVRDNGDGTFTNYKYTIAEVTGKKRITVTADNLNADTNTITDSFFANAISEITTLTQNYISEENFTQEGIGLTGISLTFFIGQVLIAKI